MRKGNVSHSPRNLAAKISIELAWHFGIVIVENEYHFLLQAVIPPCWKDYWTESRKKNAAK
jgi:hypothetical protein